MPGRLTDSVLGWLERLTDRSLARPLFDELSKRKKIKLLGRFTCLPAFAPELTPADEKILKSMIDEFRAADLQPPALTGLATAAQADRKRLERLATLAVALGELVKVDARIYLHVSAEKRLRSVVADLIASSGGVTVSQVREAVNSTRKYVVPIMEHLDRIGFTRREGDKRVLKQEQGQPEATDS